MTDRRDALGIVPLIINLVLVVLAGLILLVFSGDDRK